VDGLFPEDHYFENVGAISLIIASVISFYAFLRAQKTRAITKMHWFKLLVLLGLAGLYFFGGGEEISWGQRIFNIKEPAALGQNNTQDELNIHNLAIFENSKLLKSDTIFSVFWFSFAILIPAASLLWGRFKQFAERLSPIAYWGIGSLFAVNYIFAQIAMPVFKSGYTYPLMPYVQAVQEVKESNYEFLFIFLSLNVLWDINKLITHHTHQA
ncbi:MAG: hypothetical protein Q7J80_16600, partial [Anaerolineales bacterium]|nr:hypothetical protein [Anaerolineales bacterium]